MEKLLEILKKDFDGVYIEGCSSNLDMMLTKKRKIRAVCLDRRILSKFTPEEIATTIKVMYESESSSRKPSRIEKELFNLLKDSECVFWDAKKGIFEGWREDEIVQVQSKDIIPKYCSKIEVEGNIITIEDKIFKYTIDKSKGENGFSYCELNK